MGKISLKGIQIKGPIGIYEEEKLNGNDLSIDVNVYTDFEKAGKLDDVTYTIDYEQVYKIVERIALTPQNLLESAAYKIGKEILKSFKRVTKVEVSIEKLNPPISGKSQSAGVWIELNK